VRQHRRTIILAVLGAVVACGLVVAGLLIFRASPVPVRVSPAAQPTRPGRQPLTSPFTGEPVTSLGPVLAVKIDNIVNARPQTGLSQADIVYVLPVEGGLSRFCAVFSSHFPPVAGPVRSARDDDLQLLRQFGRPAFAYSGAQPQLLPVVERARIVDLYAGRVGGYYRDSRRIAPYNLYARTSQLRAEARGASTARDIGFRFGPAPAGGRVTAAQSVSYAYSTGSGSAVVLRDGKAWQAHWSRPHGSDGTTFTTSSGRRMTFARGPVWVVLAH
jgi:hypothetical protein